MKKMKKSKYRKLIENNRAYKDAIKFRKDFDYSKIKDVDWILDHAKEKFLLMKEYVEYLDGKADETLKHLGLGTGVIGFLTWFSCQNFDFITKSVIGGRDTIVDYSHFVFVDY